MKNRIPIYFNRYLKLINSRNRFVILTTLLFRVSLCSHSQDTTQWYWNHSFGLNRNLNEINSLNGSELFYKPGIDLKTNWKRISAKKWIFCIGFNYKSDRYKSKDYFLREYNSSSGQLDTTGYYSYHYNTTFYYLNFGFGKNIKINSKWNVNFVIDLYMGGFEKFKVNYRVYDYTTETFDNHSSDDYLDANIFPGSSVEIILQRLLKGRNFVFLSFQYDNKINSIWDRELTSYLNLNLGISTLLLSDKTGFPYKNKMKAKYKAAAKTKNAFILELLGSGFLYSINYERNLIDNEKYNLYGRVGFSYSDQTSMLNFGFSNAFGKQNTRVETGVYYNQGFFKYWDGRQGYEYMIFPFVGIRKHKNNHYLFRIGGSPFFDFKGWYWNPWFYLSFGYRF